MYTQRVAEQTRTKEQYIAAGCDEKTAQYFAAGRKRVTDVEPEDDYTLNITFDSGEVRKLDCKPIIEAGTVFESLLSLDNFRRVYVDDTHSVCWDKDPNVDSNVEWMNKIDLCPDTCYMDSVPVTETETK